MNRVYEILNKICKLNPWSKLSELDLVQLTNKNGEISMISFVEEEIKAINCFIGVEACGNYLTSLKIDEENSGYSALRYLNAYSIYFVEENNVDAELFKKFGFNDKTGYPIVSRNIYGYFQRALNDEEIVALFELLKHLYLLLKDAFDRKVKADHRLDCHLSRMYNKKENKFVNVISELFDFRSGITPLVRDIDFTDELKISNDEIELDAVILPKVDDGKIMLLVLAVDKNGKIIYENATTEYNSRADLLADSLVEVAKNYGRFKVILRDRVDQSYLAKIIKDLKLTYDVRALVSLDKYADKTVEEMLNTNK